MATLQQYDDGVNEDGGYMVVRLEELQMHARRYLEEQVDLRMDIERRRVSILHQVTMQMRYQRAQFAETQQLEREKTRRARQWYEHARAVAAQERANLPPPPPPLNNARRRRRENVAAEMADVPQGAPPVNARQRRRRQQQQQQNE